MADDPLGQPMRASEAPTEPAQLDAWIGAQLGRPLILVALRRSGVGAAALADWRAQLQPFAQVTLTVEDAGDGQIVEALTRIAQRDPDALLVCDDGSDDAHARGWRAAILDAAEGRNLFERMELALAGAEMTRAAARKLGFEDGFATDQPVGVALATLAREAVTRASYRRYGSSPPCYL